MIQHGHIQVTDRERELLDALVGAHDGASVSVTRRDPGESGPLLVSIGDLSYEIDGEV